MQRERERERERNKKEKEAQKAGVTEEGEKAGEKKEEMEEKNIPPNA